MKKTKSPSKKKATSPEKTLVAFLLDRTGSMQAVKQETIGGFNGYIDQLLTKPESKDIRVHFSQFDTLGIDVIHDCVALDKVAKLTDATYLPRANTNLYDAIGTTIRAIEAKAEGYKVLFVTSTDGEENASSDWTLSKVQSLIKEKEAAKWSFAYIGVGPAAWQANAQLSAGTAGASNVLRSTGKNTKKTYAHMADATMLRARTSATTVVDCAFAGSQLDQDEV
jgi:hypothetical protein